MYMYICIYIYIYNYTRRKRPPNKEAEASRQGGTHLVCKPQRRSNKATSNKGVADCIA